MAAMHRSEYPRPQFERTSWLNLNGEWEFDYDDSDVGVREKWYVDHVFSKRIQVPFACQSALSGINDPSMHDIVWYRRSVSLPSDFNGKRTILHFGAVDYLAWVWVNGQLVAYHEGGHTPFSADITDVLSSGVNTIVLKAQDFSTDVTLPRGKQYWKEKSESIFYTRTTGIWQTVWLEPVAETRLDRVTFTPDIDTNEVQIRAFVKGWTASQDAKLRVYISFEGSVITDDTFSVRTPEETRRIALTDINHPGDHRLWSPHRPCLYDVEFTLLVNGTEVDAVRSYFGMRKVSVVDGKLMLNNHPYFMKLVLDQGYFPDGILTAPSDEALRQDVEMTKAMGFNGARKHQKLEDPRYLYWCDKLGLLLWSEMANAYAYSEEYVRRITSEWLEAMERDYNHPCVVAWVPINESWGVGNILVDERQQQHALAMYHMAKSIDSMRPVISNDGWEHVKSDLATIHDYEWRSDVLTDRYSTAEKAINGRPAGKFIFVGGFSYEGQPIIVSEFGGIAFKKSAWEGWGYSGAENDQDYLDRVANVVLPLLHSPVVQGFCYTQLTDVEQEINGLLTYDRKPKVPLDLIRQINQGQRPTIES